MTTTTATASMIAPWPLTRRGDRDHPVHSLQYLLRARGHTVTVDGIFGPRTEAAVRAFQQSRGLPADGIAGPTTWAALVVEVRRGSRGDAVRAVQQEFQHRKLNLQVDGIFGPRTDAAVRGFQAALSLAVDGIVGPDTWRALVSGMLDGRDRNWDHIGHANDVVAMTAINNKLFAATRDNRLWWRDPVETNVNWDHIGHANDVVAMAAINNKLFAATRDNRLWSRWP
jgi:peptidoglycan hydrolase-like protein with peptidoglycan-binding domain